MSQKYCPGRDNLGKGGKILPAKLKKGTENPGGKSPTFVAFVKTSSNSPTVAH